MARAIGKSKADIAFCTQLERLVKRPIKAEYNKDGSHSTEREPLDLAATEKLFIQYGTYLELIGGDAPVEQPVTIVYPKSEN